MHLSLHQNEKDLIATGWHSLKPGPKDRVYHGLSQTDVTKREGRNAADYYGHLICGKFDRYTKK